MPTNREGLGIKTTQPFIEHTHNHVTPKKLSTLLSKEHHCKISKADHSFLPVIQEIPKLSLIDTPNVNSEKNKTSEEDNSFSLYAFEVKDTGIFYCKNGQLPIWLCARLEISALTRDPNNENWGRVLEFKDADQQSHLWIMPDALLKGNGEQVIGELLRLGLNVHPGQKERKYLLEYISSIDITEL